MKNDAKYFLHCIGNTTSLNGFLSPPISQGGRQKRKRKKRMREEARHFCQQEKTAWQKTKRQKIEMERPPFPLEGCSPPPLCMRAVCPSSVARTEQKPWLVGSPEIRVEMTCSVSLTRGAVAKREGKELCRKKLAIWQRKRKGTGKRADD